METIEILERIDYFSRLKNMTMYSIAKKSGLSMTTLYNMRERNTKPSIDTLEKICNGLDITLAQFFTDEKKIIELTDGEKNIIEYYRRLSGMKKERFLAYLEGLAVD